MRETLSIELRCPHAHAHTGTCPHTNTHMYTQSVEERKGRIRPKSRETTEVGHQEALRGP